MTLGDGYLRSDGRKGIRNILAVVYLVECAHHVARRVVDLAGRDDVHLLGFPGCYPNDYSLRMMKALTCHPNVGGVLLLSLGCEGFDREGLSVAIAATGRPVKTVVIQDEGGTRSGIDKSLKAIGELQASMRSSTKRAPLHWSDLTIGTICGGSDGTSGIAANPVVGRVFDRLIDLGATCVFEETGEMIGCESVISARAATPELSVALEQSIINAEAYYTAMGFGSFSPGNAEGGLSTLEEKSAGAYAKSGSRLIQGLIRPTEVPSGPGLYLLDIVPAEPPRFGFPNISDNAEIVELMSCGVQLTLFTTGRGSVVGSAIAPVIKITGNPETFARMSEDMDVDAGRIISGVASFDEVSGEVLSLIKSVVGGQETKSESLGHREFILGYKSISAVGPACHPGSL